MADSVQLVVNEAPGNAPASYVFPPGLSATLQSVSATFNGASASGSFLACFSIYSQNGKLIGRFFPDTTFASGDSGEVTYSTFLDWPFRTNVCIPYYGSAFAAAVLALSPRTYLQMQMCPGDTFFAPNDGTSGALWFTAGSSNVLPRQPGLLSDPLDVSMGTVTPGTVWGYVSSASESPGQNNFTYQVLMYYDSVPVTGSSRLFGDQSSGVNGWNLLLDQATNTLNYVVNGTNVGASSSAITRGNAYLIHVVRDAGTWKYYLNGSVDVANAGTDTPSASVFGPIVASVGRLNRIEHFAIWNRVLTPVEIAGLAAAV